MAATAQHIARSRLGEALIETAQWLRVRFHGDFPLFTLSDQEPDPTPLVITAEFEQLLDWLLTIQIDANDAEPEYLP